jgi:prephenate dehydrogenase
MLTYFLTPVNRKETELITALGDIIKLLGAYLVVVSPAEHDCIVAKISHAPHVLATILANTLTDSKTIGTAVFVGGGFRDTTRIAAGNPNLWKDILLYNKVETINALQIIETGLAEVKKILQAEEQEQLVEFLQKARLLRESLPKHGKGYTPALHNIMIDIADKSGNIAKITQIISA